MPPRKTSEHSSDIPPRKTSEHSSDIPSRKTSEHSSDITPQREPMSRETTKVNATRMAKSRAPNCLQSIHHFVLPKLTTRNTRSIQFARRQPTYPIAVREPRPMEPNRIYTILLMIQTNKKIEIYTRYTIQHIQWLTAISTICACFFLRVL